MRDAFADELTKLAQGDHSVVLLSGDIGNRMFDDFKEFNKGRFFNCGIAEANMMSMASGMALSGLRPVVYTITPFTTFRCLEQIRVGVCYHNAPVIIVGTGSGLSYSTLGPTHHSLEDIAMLRALPGLKIFCPSDAVELRCGLRAALKQASPVYIRLGKKGEPKVFDTEFELKFGESIELKAGSQTCIIASGIIMPEALEAAKMLEADGISTAVIDMHTIKPLDKKRLTKVFNKYSVIGVVEEHSKIGGLNSAVAEWVVSLKKAPRGRQIIFATEDRFLHEIGSQKYARQVFSIDAENIYKRMKNSLVGCF